MDDETFEVVVNEDGSASTHTVTVGSGLLAEFGGELTAEALVEASFRFLLDREPKESILGAFDLAIISRYFSDYHDMVGEYLDRG